MENKTLVNILGVLYAHSKTSDGGDIYTTRFAEKYLEHLNLENWYENRWFDKHKTKLIGTGSVYRVPTKKINGRGIDLVVKNCRVGEDVPLETHTLKEFCDAEFNSPWEEFSLVMELRAGKYGPRSLQMKTQLPMLIYVPPEKMQVWQSGRSKAKINRIRAKHPGIDLDILKQYKLVYKWIDGYNLPEIAEFIDMGEDDILGHLKALDQIVISDFSKKGYLVADTKPEHIIIDEHETGKIKEIGLNGSDNSAIDQINYLYELIRVGKYSVIDYELLLRTPEHEEEVQQTRRLSYLNFQRHRFTKTPTPDHLSNVEILGVPYVFGHAESTGGNLWVVGKNAGLFDYFLPERWRKTPAIRLSKKRDVFYTITKDNIHLVWEPSRVGEAPNRDEDGYDALISELGINSPFEEFAIAHELRQIGIPCAYVRAIYMTGSAKIEKTTDRRRYKSHKDILDIEGNPVLQEKHNYITIRGFYNGPDNWVAEQTGPLYEPVDLEKAIDIGYIDRMECQMLVEKVKDKLNRVNYDGRLLRPHDIILSISGKGEIVKDESGSPEAVICNFEHLFKLS